MKQRMLDYYNQELRHLRQMGREFANQNPKIAKRLDPDSFKNEKLCLDPYVERLLEGFAFLAARVQLKIDSEFPEFTRHLLEFVYPHYLAPTPSMMIVQMQPEDCPPQGFIVERHTVLKSSLGAHEQTQCKFLTAHQVQVLPLTIAEAQYVPNLASIPESIRKQIQQSTEPVLPEIQAAIRLRLRTLGEGDQAQPFNQLALDTLPLYLSGQNNLTALLYEQFLADAVAIAVVDVAGDNIPKNNPTACTLIPQKPKRFGFDDGQALFPYGPRSFQGYRLLQEYFAFPERFQFVELTGLAAALKNTQSTECDIYVLLKRAQPKLIHVCDKHLFALFCTPAINLFPHHADRISVSHTKTEYQVIPDRTRMSDLEVYSLEQVTGFNANLQEAQRFQPFYSHLSGSRFSSEHGYYTIQRRKTNLSAKQLLHGKLTDYSGTDTYISLVDPKQAPYNVASVKELGLNLLCTNRDLAHKDRNQFTEFSLEIDAKVKEDIQCIAGPTNPKPSKVIDGKAWRLISHLSLNYLSLMDTDEGASALRELLSLYSDPDDEVTNQQIAGVLSVTAKNVVRRINNSEAIVFGRGIEITVKFDESAFEGSSTFLLGAVLEVFFARYASINTFTETVIITDKREIMRWPIRIGQRHTL